MAVCKRLLLVIRDSRKLVRRLLTLRLWTSPGGIHGKLLYSRCQRSGDDTLPMSLYTSLRQGCASRMLPYVYSAQCKCPRGYSLQNKYYYYLSIEMKTLSR